MRSICEFEEGIPISRGQNDGRSKLIYFCYAMLYRMVELRDLISGVLPTYILITVPSFVLDGKKF